MTRSSATRAVATIAAAGALLTLSTPDAFGVRWYSQRHPLIAHQKSDPHNPTRLAAGYGNFYNLQHTHARSAVRYRDLQPGARKVYGETKFLFYSADPRCSSDPEGHYLVCWHETASDQTGRTNTGQWDGPWKSDEPLDGESTQARAKVHVCEDQWLMPDDCSAWAIVTFNY